MTWRNGLAKVRGCGARAWPLVVIPISVLGAVVAGCSTSSSDSGPSFTRQDLMDPQKCVTCHKDHVAQWSSSMHAYASDDPVFRAMNKRGQRETNGQLADFCVKCHAPLAVSTGATKDGLNLDQIDPKLKGVSCFFCHSVDAVNGDHNNPLHLADDNVIRGEYTNPASNKAHRAMYSELHDGDQIGSSKLCGTCHDIQTGHGANIERTFQEWQATIYNREPAGQTCSQCHMRRSGPAPIANDPDAKVESRYLHAHYFPAVDVPLSDNFTDAPGHLDRVKQALGNNVLQTALCVVPLGPNAFSLRAILHNVSAGHHFPSGSAQDRRLWVEVKAFQGGQTLYQSGVVADGTDPTSLTTDPDFWLIRDCMVNDQGKPVHMFWEAFNAGGNTLDAPTSTEPTDPAFYIPNRIQYFPRNPLQAASTTGFPDRVTMRVRLLPMGYEVLNDLVQSGDLDQAVIAKMPTFEVNDLEWVNDPNKIVFGTDPATQGQMQCVATVRTLVAASTTPAVNNTLCGP